MAIGGDNVKVETATYFPTTDASGNYSVKSGYTLNSGSGSANICNGRFYGNSVFGRNGAGIYYTGVLTGTVIRNSTFNSNIIEKWPSHLYWFWLLHNDHLQFL